MFSSVSVSLFESCARLRRAHAEEAATHHALVNAGEGDVVCKEGGWRMVLFVDDFGEVLFRRDAWQLLFEFYLCVCVCVCVCV